MSDLNLILLPYSTERLKSKNKTHFRVCDSAADRSSLFIFVSFFFSVGESVLSHCFLVEGLNNKVGHFHLKIGSMIQVCTVVLWRLGGAMELHVWSR